MSILDRRLLKFSLKADGGRYLSPNFKVAEFACKDGMDTIYIDLRLVHVLQQIRLFQEARHYPFRLSNTGVQ